MLLLWRGLLWRRLLCLHVKGKVARRTLVLDVLELRVDHVTAHRGDRLTPRTYKMSGVTSSRSCHCGWHHSPAGYHKHRLVSRITLRWQRSWLGLMVQPWRRLRGRCRGRGLGLCGGSCCRQVGRVGGGGAAPHLLVVALASCRVLVTNPRGLPTVAGHHRHHARHHGTARHARWHHHADNLLSRLAVHLLSRNMRAKVGLAMGWLARVEARGCKDWVACDCHGAWQVWSW